MKQLVKEIEDIAGIYFTDSTFRLTNHEYNGFRIEGTSNAINKIRNDKNQIKVLKWFKNFWVYFEIKFIEKDAYPNIYLTLSIFEGDINDDYKIQLFRAEWDNHDDNLEHPQPHWHIYPFNSFEEYQTFKELVTETADGDGFDNFVTGSPKIVDLSQFHFAMNGQWYNELGHINRISDNSALINWISGVLGHIKYQLNYLN